MIDAEHQKRWYQYYTEKRIVHQWFQLHLLEGLDAKAVLEVGPSLGLVTAMLASAGYRVTTLDIMSRPPMLGAQGHVAMDLLAIDAAQIRGFDAILCCETLEHIHWPKVGGVLEGFSRSGAKWLILSVPYQGAQGSIYFYANRHVVHKRNFFKWFKFFKRFRIRDDHDIDAHKWEIGFKGYGLRRLESLVGAHGWTVERRDFTAGCRSVFLVCRNCGVD